MSEPRTPSVAWSRQQTASASPLSPCRGPAGPGRARRRTELTLLLFILLAAAFLRLWRLDSVPPGLTHDEANNVHDAAAVHDGVRPLYFPVAQGKEPLYPYSVAALMSLLGRSRWTMRLTSAAWGLLLIVLSYAWARRAFGPAIASLTAAGLAVGFWPVTTSRMGLRAITLPVLFTAAIYFLWRGMEVRDSEIRDSGIRRFGIRGSSPRSAAEWGSSPRSAAKRGSSRFYVLAGLALGASFYTYLAARLMPLVLGLLFVYLLLHRKLAWGVLLTLVIAAVVAMPLFLYLDAHPSAEIRIGQLDRPLRALLDSDPGPLFDRVRETLSMFSFHGDTFIPYNLPGKPLLDPLMSVLFYAGLLLALWRWRRPAYALALLWLVVGFGPALATGAEAANLRAIAAQPVVYLFPALSLQAVGQWLKGRNIFGTDAITLGGIPRDENNRANPCSSVLRSVRVPFIFRAGHKFTALGSIVLFTAVAVLTYRDYFLRWANDRDVRVHYHADLMAIADYVRAHPDEIFVISALYPGQYHDPRVVEAELGGDDGRLRWADGRWAWVIPPSQDVAFIVPDAVPLAPGLKPPWRKAERVTIRPDDWNPAFDVYLREPLPMPSSDPLAQFGEQLTLFRAGLRGSPFTPGDVVEISTLWQITGLLPADRDAVLFTQILGSEGNVIAQQDRLDAPSWNWHPGDWFVQLFRMSLPADLSPGTYRLITGVYTRPDRVDAVLAGHEPDPAMPRLPVSVNSQVVGDFVELPTIEVFASE